MATVMGTGKVGHLLVSILMLLLSLICSDAFAASARTALLKAKQLAEAKGYVFFTNRDEIVSKARQEGRLYVVGGDASALPAITEGFKKKFPFIDVRTGSTTGVDEIQRFLLEIKAGAAKDQDVAKVETTLYNEYLPHLWKVDLLGMAEQGVLDVPPQMVDPKNRNVIASSTRFQVLSYNKNLIPSDQVPRTWEDLLKPEFKGKKFGADPRPQVIATLVPAWGLERAQNYARGIAAQQPVWVQGGNRAIGTVLTGETPAFLGPTYSIVRRHQLKDPLGVLQFAVLEPVPVRNSGEQGILALSRNRHAALLWLEFMGGSEAQKLLDQHEPLVGSVYSKGSMVEQELREKRLSVIGWEESAQIGDWIGKLTEAQGFPRAEKK